MLVFLCGSVLSGCVTSETFNPDLVSEVCTRYDPIHLSDSTLELLEGGNESVSLDVLKVLNHNEKWLCDCAPARADIDCEQED